MVPQVFYASEIWAVNHLESIEKLQTSFFKSIMNWSKNTPYYMIRRETSQIKLEIKIIGKMLNLWYNILMMPKTRYVRMCYNKLLVLEQKYSIGNTTKSKYNWIFPLKHILTEVNSLYI